MESKCSSAVKLPRPLLTRGSSKQSKFGSTGHFFQLFLTRVPARETINSLKEKLKADGIITDGIFQLKPPIDRKASYVSFRIKVPYDKKNKILNPDI